MLLVSRIGMSIINDKQWKRENPQLLKQTKTPTSLGKLEKNLWKCKLFSERNYFWKIFLAGAEALPHVHIDTGLCEA